MPRRHPSLVPLSHEHQHALALAFRLHHPAPPGPATPSTPASTPRARAEETLGFFARELVAHFHAEETVLFPFLRARPDLDPALRACCDGLVAEHRRLEALRDAVAGAVDDPDACDAALRAFADLLEAHVRVEERVLFNGLPPLPDEEADLLLAELQAVLRPASSG
jgi:hemerythrin superfamily protein